MRNTRYLPLPYACLIWPTYQLPHVHSMVTQYYVHNFCIWNNCCDLKRLYLKRVWQMWYHVHSYYAQANGLAIKLPMIFYCYGHRMCKVFNLILDNSVGLSAGIQSAGNLVSETLVWILHSAELDDMSPFDSKIACLCQSVKINNNKHDILLLWTQHVQMQFESSNYV